MVSASASRSGSARHAQRGGAGTTGSPRVSAASAAAAQRRWWAASGPSLERVALAFFLASVALALSCALYLYLFRYLGRGQAVAGFVGKDLESCDVFDGGWVPDESYPLYNSSECPFAERGFNCLANGREDTSYLKWRWMPRRCDVPRFTARAALERLRGKRVVFVGDSMSRTQWESFICMLMAGVDDPKTVYEVNGNEISKIIRFLGVRFASFDLTVEFFRSVFLVQQRPAPRHAPKRVKSTLRLDKMDNISRKWVNADVLIFNTGHWWTPTKLFHTPLHPIGGHWLLWPVDSIASDEAQQIARKRSKLRLRRDKLGKKSEKNRSRLEEEEEQYNGENYQDPNSSMVSASARHLYYTPHILHSLWTQFMNFLMHIPSPRGCYFQAGRVLKLGTSIDAAFRMALQTWASWVEKRVDLNRTRVFFRTYEPSHWSDLNQTICEVTEKPSSEAKGNDKSEFGAILADVVASMSIPVTVLNVTLMGAFRTDAHVGAWSYPPTILDCSHWCLPGVPDAWNELVFSYLLTNGR